MRQKIDKNLIISIFTVMIPVLMQLFYIRYISYNVDKNIYGNFVLLQTLIVALSYIFIQIPSQAYDRFYNTVKDKVEFVNEFRTILIVINGLSFLLIITYGLIFDKYSFFVLFLIFILFIMLNNYSFNQKVFLLNLERKKYFYLKLLESIAKFLTPLIAYAIYQSLESFIFGMIIGYIVAFLILLSYMKDYKFKITLYKENLKKYFKFAYPILFVSIFSWGISFIDRYFIEYFINTEKVAIYALLAQVAGIGQIVGQIYYLYVNPKILKMYEENKKNTLNYLSKMLKMLSVIFIFLSILTFFIPYTILEILLEPNIIRNSYFFYTFLFLVLGIFSTVFQTAFSMYLNLFKKLDILSYIYFIAFIINIIGNFFIIDYGIIAAAISTLVSYLAIILLQMIYVYKYKKDNNYV